MFTKSGVRENVAYKYINMRIRLLYFSRFAVGELADGEKCGAASEVPHWVIWIADMRWGLNSIYGGCYWTSESRREDQR